MKVVTTLPHGRPLTRADLDVMPEDGHRYELLDGVLIVSPSPARRHQRAVGRLFRLLDDAVPNDLEVLVAPFDVALADDTVLIPDIVVARRADLTERDLPGPPVLAVEVLSPSTRRFDLMLKRSRLEAAGGGVLGRRPRRARSIGVGAAWRTLRRGRARRWRGAVHCERSLCSHRRPGAAGR